MVCSFCRSQILESGETWGYHHHKLPQFKQSLQEECSLCARLSDDLRERFDPEHKLKFAAGQSSWLDDWLSDGSPQVAVYTWTLRKAATVTRETQEMVVLRYRPNLGTNVEQKKQDKRQQLSDRAFYFLLQDVNSQAENPQDKERGVENEEGTNSGQRTELGRIPIAHQLGGRTDSDEAWSQMSRWVNICLKSHANCARKHGEREFVPTRLVDVGAPHSKWPPDSVRVVVTEEKHKKSPYTTVSHCWGKEKFVTTRKDNFDEFTTTGVPWKQIETNANFVDAIQVTRRLGIRHIWIDSLCIIQEPRIGPNSCQPAVARKDESDFFKEGNLMHKVYRNSYCNIAAVASLDKNGSLFRERDNHQIRRLIPELYIPNVMYELQFLIDREFGEHRFIYSVLNIDSDESRQDVIVNAYKTQLDVFLEPWSRKSSQTQDNPG